MSQHLIMCLLVFLASRPDVWAQSSFGPSVSSTNDACSDLISPPADSLVDTLSSRVHSKDFSSGGWFRAGLGNCHFGMTFGASLAYTFDNSSSIVAIRYLSAREFVFNVEGNNVEPELSLKELGVLYGKSFRDRAVCFSLSAGLGFASGVDRGNAIAYNKYEEIKISTLTLPFEASIRIELWPLGIGGSWYGELNSQRSFSGWMIELYFGVLKI